MQGLADAQFNLGNCCSKGRGFPKQLDAEAVRWYHKAATQGHTAAMFNLGVMYEHGRGVDQSDGEAFAWYQEASDGGHPAAQNNLGLFFEYGRGVAGGQNEAAASHCYALAAKQGNARAQANLGFCFERGRGVALDHEEAVRWFTLAAEQGEASAVQALKELSECVDDHGHSDQPREDENHDK